MRGSRCHATALSHYACIFLIDEQGEVTLPELEHETSTHYDFTN